MKLMLQRMLKDLEPYKKEKSLLEVQYIQERLNTSLENYCADLAKSTYYLNNHISHKTVRKINK